MTSSAAVPRTNPAGSWLLNYGPISAICIAILAFTRPEYFGDTGMYAGDAVKFDSGAYSGFPNPFWEFGHLFWRPLCWVLYRCFGGLTPYLSSGEKGLSAAACLVGFSLVCGFASVLLVHSLALRIMRGHWAANLVSVSFLCFYGFLNYVHTGNAYVVGFLFDLIALRLVFRALDSGRLTWTSGLLAGIGMGLAVLIWFPFVLTAPGILAAGYYWQDKSTSLSATRSARLAFVTYVASFGALVTLAGYAFAIAQLGFPPLASIKDWALNSSHGWSQNKRLIRMASGLPRSFLNMGDDGIEIKRYLLKDPYARVTLLDLVKTHLWKLAVFYSFAAGMIWVLLRSPAGRRVLIIAAFGVLPSLVFAAFIFESGSPERYFSTYPFVCLALAFCLTSFPKPLLPQAAIAVFIAVLIPLNVTLLRKSAVEARVRKPAQRVEMLQGRVASQGMVALVTLSDSVYQFTASHPFDPVNRKQHLPVYDVVQPATTRVLTWRQEFAAKALACLKQGQPVWISSQFLAERPDPAWRWNEGDDPHVSWTEFRPVFARFTYSEQVGDTDGFAKLENSPANIALLESLTQLPATPK